MKKLDSNGLPYWNQEARQQANLRRISLHPIFGEIHRRFSHHSDFIGIGANGDFADIAVHYRINPVSVWIIYDFDQHIYEVNEIKLEANINIEQKDWQSALNAAIDLQFAVIQTRS